MRLLFPMLTVIVCIAGCREAMSKSEIDTEIESCMTNISEGGECSIDDVRLLAAKVAAISNSTENAKCFQHLLHELSALRIDNLPYAKQSYWMRELFRFGYREQMGFVKLTIDDEWMVRISFLSWLRAQLFRLRPAKPMLVVNMDEETYVSYRRWRDCYNQNAKEYMNAVAWAKKALLPPVLESLGQKDGDKLSSRFFSTIGVEHELDLEYDMSRGPMVLISEQREHGITVGLGSVDYHVEWKNMRRQKVEQKRDKR